MPITFEKEDDLIQFLKDNTAFWEVVRSQILGKEILDLSDKVNALASEVGNLASEVGNLASEVGNLALNTKSRFDRMEGDISRAKGRDAYNAGHQEAEVIAIDLGMKYIRILSPGELLLFHNEANGNLAANTLRSYRNADLVIEALDGRETVYISVEISHTADFRDSDRAIRNADLLTRYTGKRAIAAVASVRNYHDITKLIEEGTLLWHQLEDRHSEAE